MELLYTCLEFVVGVSTAVWSLSLMVLTFCWEVLQGLYTNHPHLAGLLIGVALTWLLLRRDKHPAIRILSAPLNLVLDILDLVWDQVVEVVTDTWGTVWGWFTGIYGWCKAKVSGTVNWILNLLGKVKEKLTK